MTWARTRRSPSIRWDSNVTLTSASDIVNQGTLTVRNSLENNAFMTVAITSGTLQNQGTLRFSDRFSFLNANLVNDGLVEFGTDDPGENQSLEFTKFGGVYTNNGNFNLINGSLLFGNGGIFNQNSGLLTSPNKIYMLGATMNINGGIVDLPYPVGPAGSNLVLLSGDNTVNLNGGEVVMGSVIDLSSGTFVQDGGTLHSTNGISYFRGGTYVYRGGVIDGAAIFRQSTLRIEDPGQRRSSSHRSAPATVQARSRFPAVRWPPVRPSKFATARWDRRSSPPVSRITASCGLPIQ